jgi:hypothetical protein
MANCLISLSHEFQTLATRKSGESAGRSLRAKLAREESVILDFEDSSVSPSFVDELIGILAKELGFKVFQQRVKMINVSDSSKAIIRHVLARRLRE